MLALLMVPRGQAASSSRLETRSEDSGLAVALLAVPIPASEAASEVVVVAEVEGADLLRGADGHRLDGSIELDILGERGESVDRLEQPFTLTLSEGREDLQASGLRYFAKFPGIAPGKYRVEARVATETNGSSGVASTSLLVPAPPQAYLWPPLFASTNSRWLSYGQSVGAGAASESPYPFERADGSQFVPSASPVVPVDTRVPVELFAFRIGGRAVDVAASVTAPDGSPTAASLSLVDRGGAPDDHEAFAPRVPGEASESGRRHWQALLSSSELEEEGRFVLRVEVSDLPRGLRLGASAPFAVAEVPSSAEGTTSAPSAGDSSGEADLDPLEVDPDTRLAVAQVLGVLAAGELERARRAWEAMQAGAHEGDGPRRVDPQRARKLRSAWLAAAKRIAAVDAEAVMPILLVQKLVSESFGAAGEAWLAAQSTFTLRELARLYLERLPAAEMSAVGAELFALFGDLRLALELDPDNELALLRVALEQEKSGRWEAARATLSHLSQLRPDDGEVLLRLAMNQWRSGDSAAGRRTLWEILGRAGIEVESRVGILAFQELARLEVELGFGRRAVSILERGVDRFPDDQCLRLELAFLYEQTGRPRDADRVLNRIEPLGGPAVEAPRTWYNHGPEDEIQAARERFVERAQGRLALLEAALGHGLGEP